MVSLLLLLLGLSSASAAEFSTTSNFIVKVGSTKKDANCDVVISYTGSVVNEAESSVKCSCNWPKTKSLGYSKTLSFTLGDTSEMFTVGLSIKLTKGKNKGSNTLKTAITAITTGEVAVDPEFFPTSLWCPAEDYLIWGKGQYGSIVNEAPAAGYEQCAQRCAEFTNEARNAPCFSWTINNNAEEVLGVPAGSCRLLAYMNVTGMAAVGFQSGYHKCWNAMQTVEP